MKRGVQVSIGLTVLALLACGLPLAWQQKSDESCDTSVDGANETVYTAHRWTEDQLPGIGDYLEVHYHVTVLGTPCDRNVPGPTDMRYEGLIRLRPADADELAGEYDWKPLPSGATFTFGTPDDMWPRLAPFAPAGTTWLHSEQYAQTTSTGPLPGDLFLSADRATAYFLLSTG
ncbi:hypothetical protein ADL15_36115 [Actinoplanes awajinensis subsp. mycoplanecinus]|uniref:Uncharacterized protein n=1 Tax=Actinoplanes awajinensis subsp. mycoplanecinus TaxID=135947 RepID=A0A124G8X2_9ACTN|nr:hypothetical protein ADL15_36115 [Actinoplanes awajinensis subsp. mycoplanecinus]